jgi:hypothetical protein
MITAGETAPMTAPMIAASNIEMPRSLGAINTMPSIQNMLE